MPDIQAGDLVRVRPILTHAFGGVFLVLRKQRELIMKGKDASLVLCMKGSQKTWLSMDSLEKL